MLFAAWLRSIVIGKSGMSHCVRTVECSLCSHKYTLRTRPFIFGYSDSQAVISHVRTIQQRTFFVNFTAQFPLWSTPIEPTIDCMQQQRIVYQRRPINEMKKKIFQLPSSLHSMQSTMWSIQIIIITITYRQFPFRLFDILYETMVHRPIPRSWIYPICSVQLLLMKHDLHSIVSAANKW